MAVPLLLGEGGATASGLARPGEGRAKREPDRAKPKEKSIRTLKPSPYPLPEEEGGSSGFKFTHSTTAGIPPIHHSSHFMELRRLSMARFASRSASLLSSRRTCSIENWGMSSIQRKALL